MTKFGFAPRPISRDVFAGTQSVFRMGFPPNRLEILTSISGVTFAEAFPRRVYLDIDGIRVPVISYEDLKRNKSASSRLSDQADVEKLMKSESRRNKGASPDRQ